VEWRAKMPLEGREGKSIRSPTEKERGVMRSQKSVLLEASS
jgi:hypothetical protein